jgi:hypothetical protein
METLSHLHVKIVYKHNMAHKKVQSQKEWDVGFIKDRYTKAVEVL